MNIRSTIAALAFCLASTAAFAATPAATSATPASTPAQKPQHHAVVHCAKGQIHKNGVCVDKPKS
jgi:invasion protein IalB